MDGIQATVRAELLGIRLDEDRAYIRWISFVREAFSCLNFENRTWNHLPQSGGYYDQDDFFMQVWECVRNEYIMAMGEKEFVDTLQRTKNGKSKP